ncbi:MAG: metallophosphoesterase [Alkalispirochaeta sp.]
MFDIIGDIHGHADALELLLHDLGYRHRAGAWRFPGGRRRAVFVGDFIDRGPQIHRTIEIVRHMLDHDTAWAVMGNHEYNALLWHTRDDRGTWLRRHDPVHYAQHAETLNQYAQQPYALRELLEWIKTLPLFLERDEFRVVHAAWDEQAVAHVRSDPCAVANRAFLAKSAVAGYRESEIVERLLKGVEIPLPRGRWYHDKEGTPRYKTRTRWWIDREEQARLSSLHGTLTMNMVAMPPADRELGDVPLDAGDLTHLPGYHDSRPVFVGHYWLRGRPAPFTDRIACVDYSIARGGSLCAYRFDGELPLTADRFMCVAAR